MVSEPLSAGITETRQAAGPVSPASVVERTVKRPILGGSVSTITFRVVRNFRSPARASSFRA